MTPIQRHKAKVIRTDADIESIPVLVEPTVSKTRKADAPDPQVKLVHDGDESATIEVVCSCGKKITIQCEYEARKIEVES